MWLWWTDNLYHRSETNTQTQKHCTDMKRPAATEELCCELKSLSPAWRRHVLAWKHRYPLWSGCYLCFLLLSPRSNLYFQNVKNQSHHSHVVREEVRLCWKTSRFYLKFRLCFQGDSALDIIISLHPPKTLWILRRYFLIHGAAVPLLSVEDI